MGKRIDYTGLVKENVRVLGYSHFDKKTSYGQWEIECLFCKQISTIPSYKLAKDNIHWLCECRPKGIRRLDFYEDLTNRCFMYLRVLYKVAGESLKLGNRWMCLCTCGNKVERNGGCLVSGGTNSCGCIKWGSGNKWIKGDKTLTRLRNIHDGMMQRCHNPKSVGYKHWGGRGIYVDKEWYGEKGRQNFVDWVLRYHTDSFGQVPKDYQIDRIDNNGPYAWWNCRYVSREINANNKRDTIYVEVNGEKIPHSIFCREMGLKRATVERRKGRWCAADAYFRSPGTYIMTLDDLKRHIKYHKGVVEIYC